MLALCQAATRLTDGESMSVGRDGASDAVAFLKAGVPAVEFGPSGGGHHGPDEWVSIDSLARYRRALVDFARSVPERFADVRPWRAGWREAATGFRSPGRGVLIRALIAGDPDDLAVGDRGRLGGAAGDRRRRRRVRRRRGARRRSTSRRSPRAEAGDPRTFLILGSDERYGDRKLKIKPRSDTILLVRVDPDTKRIAVMSLPRDLKVKIPGAGTGKINSAYEIGGPRKTVATIKRLFEDATGEDFPINNVINVNFGGFKRAVNYVGGVYVDVDRRYYNDNTTAAAGRGLRDDRRRSPATRSSRARTRWTTSATATATTTSSAPRASRTSCARSPIRTRSARCWTSSKRKELARIFGRYFEVDKSFVSASNLIGLAKTGLFMADEKAPVNEVRFPAYEAKNPRVDSYLYVKDSALRKTFDEFMTGKGSTNPRRVTETTKVDRDAAPSRSARRASRPSIKGLEQAPTEGENMAVVAESQGDLGFPFYFPALRKTGSRYADDKPRIYGIRDAQGKLHRAYRIVLYAGALRRVLRRPGDELEVPADPRRPGPHARPSNGRKLMLYYDGSHLRLVAWRTQKAVYWVTNTLTLSIPNSRLIAIAGSLRRLKS